MVISVAVIPGADAVLVVLPPPPPHAFARSAATTSQGPHDADSRRIDKVSIFPSRLSCTDRCGQTTVSVSPIVLSANGHGKKRVGRGPVIAGDAPHAPASQGAHAQAPHRRCT